jgi:hypothetical protein
MAKKPTARIPKELMANAIPVNSEPKVDPTADVIVTPPAIIVEDPKPVVTPKPVYLGKKVSIGMHGETVVDH